MEQQGEAQPQLHQGSNDLPVNDGTEIPVTGQSTPATQTTAEPSVTATNVTNTQPATPFV